MIISVATQKTFDKIYFLKMLKTKNKKKLPQLYKKYLTKTYS